MKSQIFKQAWQLLRKLQIEWSQALRMAWAAAKQNATIFVQTSYKGVVRAVYSASVGNCTYQTDSLERLSEIIQNHIYLNNDGAAAYYGCGHYNGD